MFDYMHSLVCDVSRWNAYKYSTAVGSAFLCLSLSMEHAGAAEKKDCIAIATAKGGALMMIDSKEIQIPAKGIFIDDCLNAVFRRVQVRLHFIELPETTIVSEYLSQPADEGNLVSTRISISSSIRSFILKSGKNNQVPAGQQVSSSGLFTIRRTADGDSYALLIDPVKEYVRGEENFSNLRIGLREPDAPAIALEGQACGVIWGLVNCARESTKPTYAAFLARDPVAQLNVGERYILTADDKKAASFTYVPPEYLTAVYQSTGTMKIHQKLNYLDLMLRRMLLELSLQSTLENSTQTSAVRAQLGTKFPHLTERE